MKLILCALLCLAGYYCKAQQLENNDETTKALLIFQLFADSVEQLINRHKLSFETLYIESQKNRRGFDTVVFEPSPNRKFFTDFANGGSIYSMAVKAQYYFVELPNIACKVTNMTLEQRAEYVNTINRFDVFFKD